MMQNKTPDDGEITLAELMAKIRHITTVVWHERKELARAMVLTGIAGLSISILQRPEYTASTRLLPYRSASSGSGGLSSIAGLAGLRLPSGAADQTVTADLYPEVARNYVFRRMIAETPLYFFDEGREITPEQYFRYPRNPLSNLLRRKKLTREGGPSSSQHPTEERDSIAGIVSLDAEYLGILDEIDDRMKVVIDKKTSIITITGQMPDRYASAELVKKASEILMTRITDIESRKASEQYQFIESQQQKAKIRLATAEREVAEYEMRNRAMMTANTQLERERIRREYELATEVYQQFSRELEQARVRMNQDTPVFTVLEEVIVPINRTSPRHLKTLLIALLLGFSIGTLKIALRRRDPKESDRTGAAARLIQKRRENASEKR